MGRLTSFMARIRQRPLLAAALTLAVILAVVLLIAWFLRFHIAAAIVDRKLATAQVPASYRITRIGPFLERMEDVRLGDPAKPDLVADRIDVAIGYGFSGPIIRHITVDGVRLRGSYDARGLSFGALDRLLPSAGGKAGLPDMPLSIHDAALALSTPAGALSVAITGEGNPARRFRGNARLAALSLRAGGCVARDVAAMLEIASNDGKPDANGPVRISGLICPRQKLMLGQGVAQIALASDARFQRLMLDANLAGFGGHVQAVQFAAIKGALSGSRSASGVGAAVKLTLKSASAPDYAKARFASMGMASGTPLDALANRAISGFATLLRQAEATADLNITSGPQQPLEVRLHRVTVAGTNGARLVATERAGLSWTRAGLRLDADIASSGDGLPALVVRLHQATAGAPLSGIAVLQPYRAGTARLAATPVRFTWDGARADFQTILTLDGPIPGGFVRGLAMPVEGYADMAGALALRPGCHTISFRQLRLSSFNLDAASVPICGQPLIARSADGVLHVDARAERIRLAGHTSDGAPVTLAATRLRLSRQGFAAQDVATTLGAPAQPTQLAIGMLEGRFRNGQLAGTFAEAGGAIGNVPLEITDSSGAWTLVGDTFKLSGALRVGDADKSARFNPLITDDAALRLRDGIVTAAATLREPATHSEVARVSLNHDLSAGVGQATLTVPGILFVPKGLQPEALTPLTLGVIANVAGVVSGDGRIDWSPKGVTSRGDFGTDRIDLAAAFGPVTGIKGRLHFTDLLGLVSAPHQEATIAEINPGVSVTNGVAHYQLIGQNRVRIEDARWPFAGGTLRLEPSILDFSASAERHLTFRIEALDAAAFIQQLDFPNISATGTFDGALPMIFDQSGGRVEGGLIKARGSGTLAYIGELSNAQLGTMGKLAFDALKAIRYSALDISLDGRLDGEMVSRVRFTGVREATPDQSLVTRLIRNLPFRFNIAIRAPFRGLVGSARAYIDPRLLLTQVPPPAKPTQAEPGIQPPATGDVR
ncbi:YdbH domain-containing protein [Sphingomonas crusticola]|uniref:YdbH domain-containing protein n=1 Tax=Sphingomonas crusticola TaxID=1697973 RepID=UPI0013C321D5|nr:YdbH domain-containing protein [Sphingomonas crusticola]